ncbi:MAG: ExeA family protein [Myxococcota bacterium]
MYNDFFGFDAEPFRVNPDPRFLYFSESHQEALSTLIYAVQQRKGFIVLTGEVGTGKTTVLNALLQKAAPGIQCAYIFNTRLTSDDFFIYLLEELDLPAVEPFRKSIALQRLNHHLIDRLCEGKQTLLIIDEAQNLSLELLEEVRMLSNLETPQSKLLQIMLVGQPELDSKLARPEIRQLLQRVELRYRIRPLSTQETREYVRQRLLIAGHESGDVFTASALRSIHRYTSGIPRVINVLCDGALLIGFVRRSPRVSARIISEAAGELGLGIEPPAPVPEAQPTPRPEPQREGFLRRLRWRRRATGQTGA